MTSYAGNACFDSTAFSGDDRLRDLQSDAPRPAIRAAGTVVNARIVQLSDGQKDCLRLVARLMTSKDIARTLGISPHTVDMRLRTAMKTLDVASRNEAARLLETHENGGVQGYQASVYQASEVAGAAPVGTSGAPASARSDDLALQQPSPRFSPEFVPSTSGPPRPVDASNPDADEARNGSARQGGGRYTTPLATALPWGARNTLSPGARLAWIASIAIGSALSFGAILGALEALKNLL